MIERFVLTLLVVVFNALYVGDRVTAWPVRSMEDAGPFVYTIKELPSYRRYLSFATTYVALRFLSFGSRRNVNLATTSTTSRRIVLPLPFFS